jgi:RimJ/RimL family protein N-acetyltransferase
MTHPLWPLFDLRVTTERLVLRLPTDDDLVRLAAVARAGMHPVGEMPFGRAWSTLPSPTFERGFAQHHWGARARWTPEAWDLHLLVERDGEPVGGQSIGADRFAVQRTVATGSWLGLPFQRQGIGKEMRSAVLALAFEGLGARVAETEAFVDNAASTGVSRALGYRPNGTGSLAPEGVARETARFRMTLDDWRSRARPEVRLEGLEACLDLFGASDAPGSATA